MEKARITWAIIIGIFLLFGFTSCLPIPDDTNYTPTPSYTTVSLPPTWTRIAPTETPEAELTPTPSPTPQSFPETPSSIAETATSLLSSELVPFKGIAMATRQEGWAWGVTEDLKMRIWHTSDGGSIWIDVSPHPKTWDFKFSLDGSTAWAVACKSAEGDCEKSLVRTTDGGRSWSVMSEANYYAYSNLQFTSPEDGLRTQYDVGAGSGFWIFFETGDGGSTWKAVDILTDHDGDSLGFGGQYPTCNICGDLLYLDQELLLHIDGNLSVQPKDTIPAWVSFDRGVSWQSLELETPSEEYIPAVFHPNKPVFFSDRSGILPISIAPWDQELSDMAFYGTRDGSDWRLLSVVENVGGIYYWNQFDYLTGEEFFFACRTDLCVTRDGAQTWERISSNLKFSAGGGRPYVSQFDFADSQNGWALVEPAYASFSLWHTTDGGRSWDKLTPDLLAK